MQGGKAALKAGRKGADGSSPEAVKLRMDLEERDRVIGELTIAKRLLKNMLTACSKRLFQNLLFRSGQSFRAHRMDAARSWKAWTDYAFDCHTRNGRIAGKTKGHFFRDEYDALKPRQKGLFDDLVE